jgi:signal transduction histidine kinase
MRRRFLHRQASYLTIRRLVILWAVSVFLAWAALVVGWLLAWGELSTIMSRVRLDGRALHLARDLELAVLAGRRADLLWQATGEAQHRERRDAYQTEAEQIAADLDPYTTSQAERDLLADIRRSLRTLRDQSAAPTLVPLESVLRSADDLLRTLRRFHEWKETQMQKSVRAARRTYDAVSYWAIGLFTVTAVLLLGGSVAVIHRVVRPALALTDAAEAFGRGQLSARAAVLHDDELGVLAQTFNHMADDISSRDRNRLDFIAMVVHDLKNPVMAVEMASRLLRACPNSGPQCRSYLDSIDAEVRQLRTIVRDLMDDVQVASGRFSVQKAPVHLCELTWRLVETEARTFADHQIVADIQERCTVLGDARRIERVVMNLLSNAIKYSPSGSQVTVRVRKEGAFAVLSVSDQGLGIPREDQEVIFLPFGRGRSAGGGAEGTGIGLYVVRRIVEAHDGRIEVDSEPGRGTEFRVRLPLLGEQARP